MSDPSPSDPLLAGWWAEDSLDRDSTERQVSMARDMGIRRVRRVTKWVAALSIAAASALSVGLAHALPGRARTTASAGSSGAKSSQPAGTTQPSVGGGSNGGFGSGFAPAPAPVSGGGGGVITSGGS